MADEHMHPLDARHAEYVKSFLKNHGFVMHLGEAVVVIVHEQTKKVVHTTTRNHLVYDNIGAIGWLELAKQGLAESTGDVEPTP